MISKVIFIVFFNLILSLLQTSFFGELVGNVFVPNLILAFSFALMFKDLKNLSLMSAFIGGLIIDFLSFNIVGISPLVLVGSLYIFSIVRRHLSKDWPVSFLVHSLSLFVYDLLLGNLKPIMYKKYLIFLVLMFGVSLLFYTLVVGVANYLRRIGISIEEQ